MPKHEGSVCGRCVPLSCTLFFFWAFGGVSSIYAVSVSKRTADKLKLLPEDIEWRLGRELGGLFFDGNTVVKRHWLIWYRIEGRAFMTMCGKWARGKKFPLHDSPSKAQQRVTKERFPVLLRARFPPRSWTKGHSCLPAANSRRGGCSEKSIKLPFVADSEARIMCALFLFFFFFTLPRPPPPTCSPAAPPTRPTPRSPPPAGRTPPRRPRWCARGRS